MLFCDICQRRANILIAKHPQPTKAIAGKSCACASSAASNRKLHPQRSDCRLDSAFTPIT
jgi:hypothetical protein